MAKTSSWILGAPIENKCSDTVCTACEYPIIVTQSNTKDYHYYCSNRDCVNHKGEDAYDMDFCSFAKELK